MKHQITRISKYDDKSVKIWNAQLVLLILSDFLANFAI